jgi:hypothetical protein
MAPVFSKLMMMNRLDERIQTHVSLFPPPIAFIKSTRARNVKHEMMDSREFKMRSDSSDENPLKMKKVVLTFEGGDAKMWCKW